MSVSKRGLLKVIIILVIIDFIAALWYVSLRMEYSGRSLDLGVPADSIIENADTLVENSVPDSFNIVESHAEFVSRSRVTLEGAAGHPVSATSVKARIPVSVNGVDSLPELCSALMNKAFGFEGASFQETMTSFVLRPQFVNGMSLPNYPVARVPAVSPAFMHQINVKVYPYITSTRLLVMEVDRQRLNGASNVTTRGYVYYDRITQRVLGRTAILNGDTQGLLQVINEKIHYTNTQAGSQVMYSASKLPAEFMVWSKGVSFIFQPGEIASAAEGVKEVFVPHSEMKPYYTENFAHLIASSSNWNNFPKL